MFFTLHPLKISFLDIFIEIVAKRVLIMASMFSKKKKEFCIYFYFEFFVAPIFGRKILVNFQS